MKNIKSCHWLLKNLEHVVILDCGMLKVGTQGVYQPEGSSLARNDLTSARRLVTPMAGFPALCAVPSSFNKRQGC
ncbi:hypothetical protein [Pseudoalteromonas sp. R3]|uniref:hypothetical protein n=1 Tax=Pseudoalteromonas sp. R3 TaxID=1709477 RepID=UPI001F4DC249|nr:hypothetical protein [Pseudoalteromonas sp. R3]